MTSANWVELALLVAAIRGDDPAARRLPGEGVRPVARPARGDRFFSAIERPIYRFGRIDPEGEQRWNVYMLSVLAFSFVSVLILYVQLRLQGHLPLNPDGYSGVEPKLAFNTAVSFMTNTNWQAYGDGVMSHLSQMAGLAFHNFVSAAAGASVAVAFIRGLIRRRAEHARQLLGRSGAHVRARADPARVRRRNRADEPGGDRRTSTAHARCTPSPVRPRSIPGGPLASQEAIKEGGQNGGGFFGANSTHPFENPNGVTNLLELWLILAIPFSLTFTFGKMARDRRQGWVVFARHVRHVAGHGAGHRAARSAGQPEPHRRGSQPADDRATGGREHGRQRRPHRRGELRLLRRLDDEHVGRRRQLHARQPHPARRWRSAGQHDVRRGQPGRHRLRAVRHVDLRVAGGVHRRAHGRAHTRVPRQEDPGHRDEAGSASTSCCRRCSSSPSPERRS